MERSNNTLQLVALCKAKGMPGLHVVKRSRTGYFVAVELFRSTGLTAGTSTLDETIAAVHKVLVDLPSSAGTGTDVAFDRQAIHARRKTHAFPPASPCDCASRCG